MEKRIKYNGDVEKQAIMDANQSLHLIKESRHIVGMDDKGKPIFETAMEFADKPMPDKALTLEERVEALEDQLKELKKGSV